jgi:crotonobetainyl-CoA:carnitine CoA-transferase CaiB-like acyl-CoA transferase
MPEPTPDRPGPLDSVRVLDLTQNLAGPYCTMLLADLGADVIKVEPPQGDRTRYTGPFTDEDQERAYGGYFASVNRGKRSIVLDLKRDEDKELFLRLVPTVDVVVESLRAGVMDRLGLGYEVLIERNPRLVYAAVRGFGDPRTGESPYAKWPSYDIVAQAMGGLVSTTGGLDGTVAKCGPSVGDLYTGALSTVGLLAAVIDARRSGTGQFVDVAMYDAVLSLSESAVYRYSCTGVVPGPTGNGHPQIAPFDLFPTADGTCGIGAPGQLFSRLCELMGRPELAADERFRTNPARLANRRALNAEIVAWTGARTTADIVALLGGEVPVGPVNDMAAIWTDPHVAARGMLVSMEQPDGSRPLVVAGQPIKMTRSGTGVRRRPPRLDEHAAEILGEAGIQP